MADRSSGICQNYDIPNSGRRHLPGHDFFTCLDEVLTHHKVSGKGMVGVVYQQLLWQHCRTGDSSAGCIDGVSFLNWISTPYALPVKTGEETQWQIAPQESAKTMIFQIHWSLSLF